MAEISTHVNSDGTSHENVRKGNFSASTAPLKDNDSTEGYVVGSPWVDTTHIQIYKCTNPAEADARWHLLDGEFVVNKTGDLITKGRVVYQNGAVGGTPTIALADKTTEEKSSKTWGVVIEDIPDNGFGYIKNSGPIHNMALPVATYTDGDIVFLSTSGSITVTEPITPAHRVVVGQIDLAHNTEGVLNVKIQNGHEFNEIHDYLETDIAEHEYMQYTSNGYYENKTLESNPVISDMNMSGNVSWGGAGDYYDEAFPDGEFRLLRAPLGRIKGVSITPSVPQDTGVLAANTANYIYIDSAGDIQSTTTRSGDLFKNNTVIFIVLYDGTNYEVVREDHPYDYQTEISNDSHDTRGTVFEKADQGLLERVTTGTGAAGTDRELKQVSPSEIHDHGIEGDFPDSSGAGVPVKHYYTNGAGKYVRDSSGTEFPMKRNNAGTAESITVNRFGVFMMCYSKDDLNTAGGKRISLMHTEEFTTQTQAQTAINNGSVASIGNELKALEMAQYGFIIVKNTAAGGHIVYIDTKKDIAGGNLTQAGGTSTAAGINTDTSNFDGNLSVADSTSQAAHQTFNDYVPASASTTVSGIQENGTVAEINSDTALRNITPDALIGSKYSGPLKGSIFIKILGGGSPIIAKTEDYSERMFCNGTITSARIVSLVAGAETAKSIQVEVYKNGSKISSSAPIELDNEAEVLESSLAGWDLSLLTLDKITFKTIGTPTAEYVSIQIFYDKTGV